MYPWCLWSEYCGGVDPREGQRVSWNTGVIPLVGILWSGCRHRCTLGVLCDFLGLSLLGYCSHQTDWVCKEARSVLHPFHFTHASAIAIIEKQSKQILTFKKGALHSLCAYAAFPLIASSFLPSSSWLDRSRSLCCSSEQLPRVKGEISNIGNILLSHHRYSISPNPSH